MPSVNKLKKTIILSGGGTGGSVTPLLAVAKELLSVNDELELLFVGTDTGPERSIVANFRTPKGVSLRFRAIPSGKLRRYFSWRNFSDLFKIITAFFVSCRLLRQERPGVIVSAGGFVSVPLVWAAYFLNIPVIIHQQDVRPGLANRLMAPVARLVTVTFEKSLRDYGQKAAWIGNPSPGHNQEVVDAAATRLRCGFCANKPLVLITGGATGSVAINNLVFSAAKSLSSRAQIMHLTGKGKLPDSSKLESLKLLPDYRLAEFMQNDDLLQLMASADLIVSRCGLATLTELCALGRPAILIPMPDSHQEDNALVFEKAKAAVVLNQKDLSPLKFSEEIFQVIFDSQKKEELARNISRVMKKDGADIMASFILEILK